MTEKNTSDKPTQGIDLSLDADNGDLSLKNFLASKRKQQDISLDVQTYGHRKILFWVVLSVCAALYLSFFYYVFWSHYFRLLVIHTQLAVGIALSLILVPSALLWGILRSVYKDKSKEKDEDAENSIKTTDIAKTIHALTRIYPPSSH